MHLLVGSFPLVLLSVLEEHEALRVLGPPAAEIKSGIVYSYVVMDGYWTIID